MKAAKLHLLTNEGTALCMGKRPAKLGTEPCARCEDAKNRRDEKAARRVARESARQKRAESLKDGLLFKQSNGIYALRYILDGKTVEQSLGERSEARAKTLAPLCMRYIRRTGKRLYSEAKCFADTL